MGRVIAQPMIYEIDLPQTEVQDNSPQDIKHCFFAERAGAVSEEPSIGEDTVNVDDVSEDIAIQIEKDDSTRL